MFNFHKQLTTLVSSPTPAKTKALLHDFAQTRKALADLAPLTQARPSISVLVTLPPKPFNPSAGSEQVRLGKDGIKLKVDGEWFNHFIYMKKYRVENYGKLPVAHIIQCSKVQDIGRSYYYAAASALVDIEDRDTGQMYYNKKLSICKFCLSETTEKWGVQTTEEFVKFLEQREEKIIEQGPLPTNIDGYDVDWSEISQKFRQLKQHTCDSCGISMASFPMSKRFIHVDHVNGNKNDNRVANLKCLCILCHAHKDALHQSNFSRPSLKTEIKTFIDWHRDLLLRVKNPYLTIFEQNNKQD